MQVTVMDVESPGYRERHEITRSHESAPVPSGTCLTAISPAISSTYSNAGTLT
jgi:hypothetical protein